MKSLLIGVFWPAWEWGPRSMPHMRYVCASHSQDLAIRDSLRMRRLVKSEWYQGLWGDRVKLTSDQDAKAKFETTATGFRQACAFEGITGYRGDRVIIDDPHSVDDANSDAKRETATNLFKEAVASRLNNPDKSAIVV
ncbi:terminase, partial [bacterium]|nr:terminase [bacterium]